MTKKIDLDVLALERCCLALETETRRMRKATLEFLWDKYVTNGEQVPEPEPESSEGGLRQVRRRR